MFLDYINSSTDNYDTPLKVSEYKLLNTVLAILSETVNQRCLLLLKYSEKPVVNCMLFERKIESKNSEYSFELNGGSKNIFVRKQNQ